MQDINYYLFKIVMLGDSGVGKSNISTQYLQNVFNVESKSTVAMIKIQLWDISGDEKYRSLIDTYCSRAMGALIVYDITNRTTFENVEWWLKEFRRSYIDPNNVVIMLVGNKTDIADRRQVSTEEAKSFAERENLLFMETSALCATNVEEGFTNVLTQIYHNVTSP
ncbi:hypothetical protein EUTSA_v10001212mg [Eutrema salsugineum]|uniref:Uncharacterized protein n=1 Tax=Eutrema salsugineum TaxID=72664 RepID=V4LBG6_EUTSA|nr:hypothetical protein EUTSA_v10001212mg [Eutrema salsugineum]